MAIEYLQQKRYEPASREKGRFSDSQIRLDTRGRLERMREQLQPFLTAHKENANAIYNQGKAYLQDWKEANLAKEGWDAKLNTFEQTKFTNKIQKTKEVGKSWEQLGKDKAEGIMEQAKAVSAISKSAVQLASAAGTFLTKDAESQRWDRENKEATETLKKLQTQNDTELKLEVGRDIGEVFGGSLEKTEAGKLIINEQKLQETLSNKVKQYTNTTWWKENVPVTNPDGTSYADVVSAEAAEKVRKTALFQSETNSAQLQNGKIEINEYFSTKLEDLRKKNVELNLGIEEYRLIDAAIQDTATAYDLFGNHTPGAKAVKKMLATEQLRLKNQYLQQRNDARQEVLQSEFETRIQGTNTIEGLNQRILEGYGIDGRSMFHKNPKTLSGVLEEIVTIKSKGSDEDRALIKEFLNSKPQIFKNGKWVPDPNFKTWLDKYPDLLSTYETGLTVGKGVYQFQQQEELNKRGRDLALKVTNSLNIQEGEPGYEGSLAQLRNLASENGGEDQLNFEAKLDELIIEAKGLPIVESQLKRMAWAMTSNVKYGTTRQVLNAAAAVGDLSFIFNTINNLPNSKEAAELRREFIPVLRQFDGTRYKYKETGVEIQSMLVQALKANNFVGVNKSVPTLKTTTVLAQLRFNELLRQVVDPNGEHRKKGEEAIDTAMGLLRDEITNGQGFFATENYTDQNGKTLGHLVFAMQMGDKNDGYKSPDYIKKTIIDGNLKGLDPARVAEIGAFAPDRSVDVPTILSTNQFFRTQEIDQQYALYSAGKTFSLTVEQEQTYQMLKAYFKNEPEKFITRTQFMEYTFNAYNKPPLGKGGFDFTEVLQSSAYAKNIENYNGSYIDNLTKTETNTLADLGRRELSYLALERRLANPENETIFNKESLVNRISNPIAVNTVVNSQNDEVTREYTARGISREDAAKLVSIPNIQPIDVELYNFNSEDLPIVGGVPFDGHSALRRPNKFFKFSKECSVWERPLYDGNYKGPFGENFNWVTTVDLESEIPLTNENLLGTTVGN